MMEGEEDTFSTLHDQWITKTRRKSELMQEAGKWKNDMWTPKEVLILKHNVAEFLEKNNLDDPAAIIFRKRNYLRSEFFHSIARNIQRPLFAVYRKVVRDFNVENYVHKWSPELTEQLLMQYSIHGNKWSVIGRAIGVSSRAARDRYRLISNRQKTGAWEPEEEDRLLAAMKRSHGESIVKQVVPNSSSVTWNRVAELVKTRNGIQCRTKWLYTEFGVARRVRRSSQQPSRWSQQQDLDLLNKLFQENAEDEEEIDWLGLSHGWDNVRSPHQLRSKWSCLRRRVPGYALKSFEENLEYLIEHFVPILNRRLKDNGVMESEEHTVD